MLQIRAIAAGLSVLLVLGGLWWLHHSIYTDGLEAATAKCNAEKEAVRMNYLAQLEEQRHNLMEVQNEISTLRQANDVAIAESGKHRMYVRTKNPICPKESSTGGIGGTGDPLYRSELDREAEQAIRDTFAEVAAGAEACKEYLLSTINNVEVVK